MKLTVTFIWRYKLKHILFFHLSMISACNEKPVPCNKRSTCRAIYFPGILFINNACTFFLILIFSTVYVIYYLSTLIVRQRVSRREETDRTQGRWRQTDEDRRRRRRRAREREKEGENGRGRDTGTGKDTERRGDRETDRDKETDSQRYRDRERHADRQRRKEKETDRERETYGKRQTETDRVRERYREKDRERRKIFPKSYEDPHIDC